MKTIKQNAIFRTMHYLMVKALVQFTLSSQYVATTDSIPAFRQLIDRLKEMYDQLTTMYAQKAQPITSYAAQKRELKGQISTTGNIIMNAVYNYALSVGNSELAGVMRINRNQLLKLSYTAFVGRIQNAIDLITPIIDSLGDYNVTEEQVEQWQTDLTLLNSILPKTKHSTRKALNTDIQNTLRQCMMLVYNECDRMVLSFQEENLNYYNTWLANRKLDPFTKHTKFRVTVTDEQGNPLFNIPVQQDQTTNIEHTDINGQATVYVKVNEEPDSQPVYSFILTSGEQQINTGPVEILMGHTVSKDYIMQPSNFNIPAPTNNPVPSDN